ncbi:bifunctional DNA primase/polymerase [Streptomyces sp. SID11385]|uniref:bifunctional DNA primase/polymerase n=1 Tax=Streptomyces sp. SID11385 TaxID=2706031 RepID=UPI0013CC4869|nr:bifunctional DNA primase/polymerase [Streptomyces sp. SID11385]NEA43505.1 bifunctional DNA primase/polymerase [Streptomyces sp. SID11385]
MTHPTANGHRPGPFWAPARAAALTYATRYRLPVFPLTRTKLPALPAAHPDGHPCIGQCGTLGHGVHDATADPQRVKGLFAAAPWAAGFGIACGRAPHHLIGLDLDRKNGVNGVTALRRLAAEHQFTVPRTTTVRTTSGGLHLWLTTPPGTRAPNSASRLGGGIDVRGHGGYLVGPGSLGPTARYTLAPDHGPREIAEAPPALLRLLNTPTPDPVRVPRPVPAGGSPRRRLDGLVRVVLDCGPNDLNNRLYWAARTALGADDIDPDEATARLLAAAVECGHPEVPARRTLGSAAKGAARDRMEA